jgi:hypothetical protein
MVELAAPGRILLKKTLKPVPRNWCVFDREENSQFGGNFSCGSCHAEVRTVNRFAVFVFDPPSKEGGGRSGGARTGHTVARFLGGRGKTGYAKPLFDLHLISLAGGGLNGIAVVSAILR